MWKARQHEAEKGVWNEQHAERTPRVFSPSRRLSRLRRDPRVPGLAGEDPFLSHGEVTKPETINYRTSAERGRPLMRRIFARHRLGVPVRQVQADEAPRRGLRQVRLEVTRSKVRRERMGHIELAAPVSHVWFFKGLPAESASCSHQMRELERVLYFEAYVVIEPRATPRSRRSRSSRRSVPRGQAGVRRELRRKMGAESIQSSCAASTSTRWPASFASSCAPNPRSSSAQKAAQAARAWSSRSAIRETARSG